MPKFAANLTMLFSELPFMDRFAAAARAGFEGVEYASPYDYPKDDLAAELKKHGLVQVLFNLPMGDAAKGDRGIACLPDRVEEFRSGVARAIGYAQTLGNRQINCIAGIAPAHADAALVRKTFIENLRYAAEQMQPHGIRLIAEPINVHDVPGFYLNRSAQALEISAEVGSDNLKLQYDIYHMQRMEGEIANTIVRILPDIAHIQFADTPGRHEPGTGELNFPFLFRHLDTIGYDGWVSAEYWPAGKTTEEGLGWFRDAMAAKVAAQ